MVWLFIGCSSDPGLFGTLLPVDGPRRSRIVMSRAAKLTANSAPVTTSTQYDGIELSIIVPTFNERHNIQQLITRLSASLEDVAWEVIFVDDDSPDGTADLVRRIAKTDRRVRCLQRVG